MNRPVSLFGRGIIFSCALMSFAAAKASAFHIQAPVGWTNRTLSEEPLEYTVGLDSATAHSGRRSAYLQSRGLQPQGWTTLMQTFRAEPYRGKRVKMSAFVKPENLDAGALLFMRVDGPGDSVLAFDNMGDRPIRGTADWRQYNVVLEVPTRATAIAVGLVLEGGGRVWLDDVTVRVAPVGVESTAPPINPRSRGSSAPVAPIGDVPVNLDFEH